MILLLGKLISRVPLMKVKHDFQEVNKCVDALM